jgi:hypothetical protein
MTVRGRLIVAAVCAFIAIAAMVAAAAPWDGGDDSSRVSAPASRPFFSVSLA